MTTPDNVIPFAGFQPPQSNFFKVPNMFWQITDLDIHERFVLLYILRHTWGYQEFGIYKTITIDEFQHGRKTSDGMRMDNGCGVSRGKISQALNRLAELGYILTETDASDLARVKKSYMLNMAKDSVHHMNTEFMERTQSSPGDNRTEKETKEIHIEKEIEKKKESAGEPQGEKIISPFLDTSYQGIYAVIADKSFGFGKGDKIPQAMSGRIGKVVKAVRELEPIPSAAEIHKAYQYQQEINPDGEIPKGETTVISMVQGFRKSSDYPLYESHKEIALNTNTDKVSAASPPVAPDNPPDFQPSQEWIDAQPDYSTPEQVAEMRAMFEAAVTKMTSKKLVGKVPPSQKVGA